MPHPTDRHDPPHAWVAQRLGYSYSGISLLRLGTRGPTVDSIPKIAEAFDWPISDQYESLRVGQYVADFNAAIKRAYDKEQGQS